MAHIETVEEEIRNQEESCEVEPGEPETDRSEDQQPRPTADQPIRRRAIQLPRPPKRNLTPDDLFQYWSKAVAKVGPKRVSCRVYRTWPVIDMTMGGKHPKAKKYVEWDDAPEPWTEWRPEMLHRFGSGSYKLYLVDNHSQRELCRASVESLEDPDYPPAVDPETLVMDDPRNRSYIQSLRQKGILIQEELKRMENQTTQVAEQLGKIAEKALEAAIKSEQAPARKQESTQEEAANKAIEVMGMAAKQQAELLRSSFERALEAQNPKGMLEMVHTIVSALKPHNSDPAVKPTDIVDKVLEAAQRIKPEQASAIDTLDKLAEIAAKLRPQNDSMAEVMKVLLERSLRQDNNGQMEIIRSMADQQREFYQRMLEMQQQQINYLREEIKNARQQNPGESAARQIREVLETVISLKDGLGEIFGSGGATAEKASGNWLDVVKTLAQAAPSLGNLVAQLGMAFSVARASRQASTEGQPPAPPAPVAELPAPSQNPQPEARAQQAPSEDPFPGMGQAVIRYLNEGKTGEEFAGALIAWYGDIAYQQIRGMGEETLFNALASYPGTAAVVAAAPDRVRQFVHEFVHAEELWRQLEEMDNEQPEPPAVSEKPKKIKVQ